MKEILVVSTVALSLVGCGGTYDASVHGVVTLDGKPLARGTLAYDSISEGPLCYGLIQSDGTYSLQTGSEAGIPSGQYKVTVVANEASTPSSGGGPPAPGKPITPPWYRTKTATPLEQAVQPGSNEINLELTSEPPAGWDPKKRPRR